jgi:EAL domain-containing protein (putative c-di-GMP-specific phosphodiesterase class I)
VESEAILKLLRGYGVDYAQGHHLGKPRASIDLPKPNVDNVIPLI